MPTETPEKTEETPIDLDNPETWPNDIDSLAQIAGEDTGNADVFAGERKAEAKPTEDDPGTTGDEPKEPETAEADPAKPKEGEATEADLDKLKPHEAVLKTPDGKHEIPFDVLKSTRARAHELEEENRKLQEQLAAKQATEAAAAAAAATETPAEADKKPAKVADVTLSEEQKAEVEQVREEYGEQIATLHENHMRTTALLEQQLAESNAINERLAREDQAAAQDESTLIQNAIDATPQMVAWQTGDTPDDVTMYDRAVELHQHLLKNDSAYAAMDWADRFAVLPAKVVALHGEGGTMVKATPGAKEDLKPTATDQDAIAAKAAKEKAKADADNHPVTMSDMPAGEIPVSDEITRSLENQTPAQMQEMMNRLASQPGKLHQFLDGLS